MTSEEQAAKDTNTPMNTTSFFSSNQWLGTVETPIDINDRASNLLRRKRMNVCLHCGEIYARIYPDQPLFRDEAWNAYFHPCHMHGGRYLFFNDWELTHLLPYLPQSILSAELVIRAQADACPVERCGL